MNLHRALLCSLACAAMSMTVVGCESYNYSYNGPQYMGRHSDRAMNNSMWQVTGEAKPEVPMPEVGPAPVPPHQQRAGQPAPSSPAGSGQNK